MDGFWALSLSASVDEVGVRSCACAADGPFPFPFTDICGGETEAALRFSLVVSSGEDEEGSWVVAIGMHGRRKRTRKMCEKKREREDEAMGG